MDKWSCVVLSVLTLVVAACYAGFGNIPGAILNGGMFLFWGACAFLHALEELLTRLKD